jgi:menaquinone-dependent protoporphyrinogen oxidase
MPRVLVAYGSRYGTSEEIASRIASVLEEQGIDVDLKDLRSRPAIDLGNYDGVIVGSGIKVGRWTKEAEQLLKELAGAPSDVKIGVFVSCLQVLTNPEGTHSSYLDEKLKKMGVGADIGEAFPGKIDFSSGSRMGMLDKKMVSVAAKEMEQKSGIEIDRKGVNDFRDWEAIDTFARTFATLVSSDKQ